MCLERRAPVPSYPRSWQVDPLYRPGSGPLSALKGALLEPIEWFGRRGLFGLADGLFGRNDPLWPPNLEPGYRVIGDSPRVLRMKLVGANSAAKVEGIEELPGKSNYFIGNDPKKWCTNVPTYRKVTYKGVYPRVDLVYYGNQRQVEYDFVVAPGADPNQIRMALAGAGFVPAAGRPQGVPLHVDPNGDIVAHVGDGEIRFHKPLVYQPGSGKRQLTTHNAPGAGDQGQLTTDSFQGHFILEASNEVHFHVSNYDRTRPLVIDPTLSYSTYLGGGSNDYASSIAIDSAGNAYVAGYTSSTDFPTVNALQPHYAGGSFVGLDAFVAKLNAAGSALVYSTYLGGSADDYGYGIAVDSSGNAHVTGFTGSTDFPTVNPLQATNHGGGDAFVAKLNAAGSALVYSTYLGGSSYDDAQGIAVDSSGNAYVTGITQSTDFPTVNPLQASYGGGSADAFVAKLNAAGSALVYSTYLGGSDLDYGYGIAVDSSGNTYVTGRTASTNFPTVNPLQAE